MKKCISVLLSIVMLGYVSISYAENGMKNKCEDFYPTDSLDNLLTQIYNHLDEPCLRDISTHHLDKLGVAIAIYPYGASLEEEFRIREEALKNNPSKFLIILTAYDGIIRDFPILINPIFEESGKIINTFTQRTIPKLPIPYRKYRRHTTYIPFDDKHPVVAWNDWGEFESWTAYEWLSPQTKSEIRLETGYNPGNEYIDVFLK